MVGASAAERLQLRRSGGDRAAAAGLKSRLELDTLLIQRPRWDCAEMRLTIYAEDRCYCKAGGEDIKHDFEPHGSVWMQLVDSAQTAGAAQKLLLRHRPGLTPMRRRAAPSAWHGRRGCGQTGCGGRWLPSNWTAWEAEQAP